MGQDIHCYIEYRRTEKTDREKWEAYDAELKQQFPDGIGMPAFRYEPQEHWSSMGARINPGRNYGIFGRLSGGGRGAGPAIVPARGMPEDAGYYAEEDEWQRINHDKDDDDDDGYYVTAETAEQYHSYGSRYKGVVELSEGLSKQYENGVLVKETPYSNAEHVGKPLYVGNPDHHSHSWATPDEWAAAIAPVVPAVDPEYFAILAAMRELQRIGYEARVVFWFDN